MERSIIIKILPGPRTVARGTMNEINVSDMAQDRDRRMALVNAVMNLQVPLNAVNLLTG